MDPATIIAVHEMLQASIEATKNQKQLIKGGKQVEKSAKLLMNANQAAYVV